MEMVRNYKQMVVVWDVKGGVSPPRCHPAFARFGLLFRAMTSRNILQTKSPRTIPVRGLTSGGELGTRTPDPLRVMQVL